MKKQLSSLTIILSLGLLLYNCDASAQSSNLVRPKVDASIDVDPQTDVLKVKVYATGVQMYNFVLDEKTQKYVLDVSKSTPKAMLFDETGKQIGTHGKGPFWESSLDYSKVEGNPDLIKKFPSPNSIAWLLLETKKQDKPGNGIFSNITKIQRVETSGGVPLTGGLERTAPIHFVFFRVSLFYASGRGTYKISDTYLTIFQL